MISSRRVLLRLLTGLLPIVTIASAQLAGLASTKAFALSQAEICADLQLSELQQSAVAELIAEFSTKQGAIYKGWKPSSGEAQHAAKQAALDKLEVDYAGRLLSKLSPTQKNRLGQLALQELGTEGMIRADVAKELGLSADQKKQIGAIVAALRKRQEDLDSELGTKLAAVPEPKNRTAAAVKAFEDKRNSIYRAVQAEQKKLDAIREQDDKRILLLLSDAQRSKWSALLGPKLGS